ncbi:MAG: group III truncated hemoglobin [Actinobacteria bacterium]|nr:group III truncated hemoglobin [Actinomycetota bacterium]
MNDKPKPDLTDPFEIAQLVRRFYARIRKDDLLGPIFDGVAKVDWSAHLPKLTAFWSGVLLGLPGFQGAPMRKHALIHMQHPLEPAHFQRWVALFMDTVDAGWSGPRADYAKQVAASVARGHAMRLTGELLEFDGSAPGIETPNVRTERLLAKYGPEGIPVRGGSVTSV